MTDNSNFVGKQIGSYRIVNQLSTRGGFGSVYLGKHIVFTNRPIVAIKVLHTHLASEQEQERFLQEARFLDQLKHPHILPIIEAGTEDGLPFLIAEYASGGSLKDRLQKPGPYPLSLEEALTILSQIGQALQYAHQHHIVHRDLKPDNILFNTRGEALLADFGIATVLDAARTKPVDNVGSPPYMAPEQFDGIASMRSDQYALGCIAYELVTGRKPFEPQEPGPFAWPLKHRTEVPRAPTELNPRLPMHIEQAILKALAKDRTNRHPDVSTFITALSTTKEHWLKEGDTHLRAKQYEEALNAFEQALRLDPDDAVAYNGKGRALYNLKRYEEAVAAYEQALRLDPNDAVAYNNKGYARGELKRYEEAVVAFEQALRLNPNYAVAYNGKGHALSELKRYEEAVVAFEQALRLNPNYAVAYNGKGHVLLELKRYEEAVAAYEQALRLNPNDAVAYYSKSRALSELKWYKGAVAVYEPSLDLDPNDAVAYYNKGYALTELKQYEEAVAVYEPPLGLDPNDAVAYYNKGRTLYNLKRYEEAVAAFEQALHLDPNDAVAYNGKGYALTELKRYEEAVAAYEQALHLDPNYAVAYYNKGYALKRLGRNRKAQRAYEKARQLALKSNLESLGSYEKFCQRISHNDAPQRDDT